MNDRSIVKTYEEITTSLPRTEFEIIKEATRITGWWSDEPAIKDILVGYGKQIYLALRARVLNRGRIESNNPFRIDALFGFLQDVQEAHPEADLKTCVMNACKQGNIHEDEQDLQALLALLDTLLATSSKILQQSSQEVLPPAFLNTPYGQASGKEAPAAQEPASAAAGGLPVQALEAAGAQSDEPEQQDARLAREPAVSAPDASGRAKPPTLPEAQVSPAPKPEQKPHIDPFLVGLVEGAETLNIQINNSIRKQLLLRDQLQQISRNLEETRQQSEEMRQQSENLFESIASLPDDYVRRALLMQVERKLDASKHQYELQSKQVADKIIELIDYFVNILKFDEPFAAKATTSDAPKEQERDSVQIWKTAVLNTLYVSLLGILQKTCGVVPIDARIGQPYQQGSDDIIAQAYVRTDDFQKDRQIAIVSQLGYRYTDGRPFRPAKVIFYRFMAASQG